jgi:hypothetical protein
MQRRSLVSSLPVIVALLGVLLTNFPASAHSFIPATTDCRTNGGCISYVIWGNQTQFPIVGAQTNMTISNPAISTNNGDWTRSLSIYSFTSPAEIETGIEKVGGGNNYVNCPGANMLWFFIYITKPDGSHPSTFCRLVPSGDINAQATFKIQRNSDNSYEIIANYKNHDSPCEGGGCSAYQIQAPIYHYIKLQEVMQDLWSNAHKVWGSAWGWNEYQDPKTLNFYFQPQANCNGQGSGGCPRQLGPQPSMYWNILPQGSSHGGELYSCDYDPAAACTYGS